jgi:transcriptional regulator with XRE-family HTH domain
MRTFGYLAGKRINMLRKEKGMTQEKLVDVLFKETGKMVSVKTIGKWENGETSPNAQMFKALGNVLECDAAYLMGESDAVDASINAAIKSLGISEKAAYILKDLNDTYKTGQLKALSKIIENEYILEMISTCMFTDYGTEPLYVNDPSCKGCVRTLMPELLYKAEKMHILQMIEQIIDNEHYNKT